jgi:hypothetical protein
VMEHSLNNYGYTKDWLLAEVMKQGAKKFEDVFLAQINSKGDVFIDLYEDTLKLPQMKQRLLAAANIQQLHANFQNFSIQTNDNKAKQRYNSYAQQMNELLDEMAVYLKD